MAVILAVAVAVTPAVAVAVADRRRLTVLQAAVAADRATPAMEDTNTNPDMCSPGETISVLNHVGFHQVSRIGRRKTDLSRRQDSSVRLARSITRYQETYVDPKRPTLIER